MAVAVLRPNATFDQGAYTITGAASAHAATSDDSDSSYISPAAGTWLCILDIGPLTLPAYAQIRAVSVRVKRLGNSSATFDVALGWQPPHGSYQSKVLCYGDRPSSTIAVRNYGSLVLAPGGLPWDNDTIIPNLQVSFGSNSPAIRIHEVYVDVTYDQAPSAVITGPLGTITGSQLPEITFTYSDAEGSPLERVYARVFTAAQAAAPGFGPDVSTAFWDSGEVLTSSASLRVTAPLPAGDYQVWLKVADAGSGGRYGPWVSAVFTMGGHLPATPLVSASPDPAARRNTITVTQQDNYLTYGQSAMAADGGEGDGWYADTNTTLASIGSTAATVTTLAETFTGADGAVSAANTDLDWTTLAGSFSVASNQLTEAGGEVIPPPVMRTNADLASANHYVQCAVNTLSAADNRSVLLTMRMSASANTGYVIGLNQKYNFIVVEAIVAGVGIAISGFVYLPKPLALPATFRGEVRGDEISVYLKMANDSALQLAGTWHHSLITTGTRAGIGIYNGGGIVRADSFEAGDLDPVVGGSSGDWLLEMTAAAARPARAFTGGRYGWGTPVTPGEQVTVVGSCWQDANQARQARIDLEYHQPGGDPLATVVFAEDWPGADGAGWDADWAASHAGAADDTTQAGRGRLTTGTTAYGSPARIYASGMPSMADCEITVLMVPSSTTAEMRGMVAIRTDGAWSAAFAAYPAAGYIVELDPQADEYNIRRGDNVSVPVLATIAHTIPAQGVHVRLRAQGTSIMAKAWDAGLQEPARWDWAGVDATYAAGRVSMSVNNGADAVARSVDYDDLTCDDLSAHSFGPAFTTGTGGEMVAHSRNVTVPAGAGYANTVLVGFPTGTGEVFVWDSAGVLPGAGREWSRGGLAVANMYGPNAASFEVAAAGVAGWAGSTDTTVARAAYVAPPAGAALNLSWAAGVGRPLAIQGHGPARPAVAGRDYAVGMWLWRASGQVSTLRAGIRFTDASGGLLAESFSADVLPEVGVEWAAASHTARAPVGTVLARAVAACTPVQAAAGAVTRICLVPGTVPPAVFQPGPSAAAYAYVEYSDDGGLTWEQVRGTTAAAYPASRVVAVYDYEAPPGATRLYRASTAAVDYYLDAAGGAVVASAPSGPVAAALTPSGFWLKNPLVPAMQMEVTHGGDLDHSSREPQEAHETLGRENVVSVSDIVKGEVFALPLVFKTAAAYRLFESLRKSAGPLLFQSDFGEQWYVKLGPVRRTVLKTSVVRSSSPLRLVELAASEVDRPDAAAGGESVVTDLVWELV